MLTEPRAESSKLLQSLALGRMLSVPEVSHGRVSAVKLLVNAGDADNGIHT